MLGEVFDPKAELLIAETCRPHWSQAGAIVFVTFRTHDSIPADALELWKRQKQDWLARRGFANIHWTEALTKLSSKDRSRFNIEFNRRREDFLDANRGRCLLQRPELAEIVANSLLHFDGDRYRMGDFVVMPNHVHLLCAFANAESMRQQFDSWQHYTAVRINRQLGETGKFWQGDPFDHLVRSADQYESLRDYIADNPKKAGLASGQYHYRRYEG
jgi:putative transposase